MNQIDKEYEMTGDEYGMGDHEELKKKDTSMKTG